MEPTRRIDLWVGRGAAIAGIVYVCLASLWPIAGEAAEAVADASRLTTTVEVLSPWPFDVVGDATTDEPAPPDPAMTGFAVVAALVVATCAWREHKLAPALVDLR